MALRMKFTDDEIIAFQPGTDVEWQNGSHWRPGIVVSAPAKAGSYGPWWVGVVNVGVTTATVKAMAHVRCEPGKVRLKKDS